jgi:hypothetical protein
VVGVVALLLVIGFSVFRCGILSGCNLAFLFLIVWFYVWWWNSLSVLTSCVLMADDPVSVCSTVGCDCVDLVLAVNILCS